MAEPGIRNYGTTSPQSPDDTKKDYADDIEGYASSDSSSDDPKATHGVKTIEAISQAWTGWTLFLAYFGY